MTAKKQKDKDRRRARKLAEQAWEAANANNLDLAVKIMRRAADTQPDNPVLYNDLGVLLLQAGDDREADRSFRAALSLAHDYASPSPTWRRSASARATSTTPSPCRSGPAGTTPVTP